MLNLAIICFLLPSSIITAKAAQNSGKYTDENRPYEFGFNIEGEQHRKEKKDENGLIMGEFGFITADGVYHVTVYATDENGNFRIISMKNIRLGPAPKGITQPPVVTAVITTPQPVTFLPPPPPPVPQQIRRSEQLVFTTLKPLPIASCSHCSIPSTTLRPPPNIQLLSPPLSTFQPPFPSSPQNLQGPFQQNQNQFNQQGQVPNGFGAQNFQPTRNQPPLAQFNQQAQNFNQPQNDSPQRYQQQPFAPNQNPSFPVANFDPTAAQRQTQSPFQKPLLISGSIQPVDPSAVTLGPLPGEQEGLPPGITVDDMVDLLYRFNYTVGFHGHYEEGFTNGDKKGEYYVNNRNGYATKISYIANERGFQPKISTIKITPLQTPYEGTEKEERFGLKGYEFTWFYVPKYHFLNQQ